YHPYRRASQRGEPCHPELSIRTLHSAGIPGAVSLAASLGRVLGQSQRSAHGVVGLLPPGPFRAPCDDQGRPAGLSRCPASSCLPADEPPRRSASPPSLLARAQPERYVESFRFDTMPSSPSLQAWRNTISPSSCFCINATVGSTGVADT